MASVDYLSIGGGKLYIQKLVSGVLETDLTYFGMTDEINLSSSSEYLEHNNTESSVQKLDKKIATKQSATLSFTTTEISKENIMRAFLGGSEIVSQTAGSVTSQEVVASLGKFSLLGKQDISNVVVTDATDATTYVLGTDYLITENVGMIEILSNGTISEGETLHVSFDYATKEIDVIQAFQDSVLECKLTFISEPQSGDAYMYEFHKVNLSQNGDMALKSDDWITLSFEGEVLEDDSVTVGSKFMKITKI